MADVKISEVAEDKFDLIACPVRAIGFCGYGVQLGSVGMVFNWVLWVWCSNGYGLQIICLVQNQIIPAERLREGLTASPLSSGWHAWCGAPERQPSA